MELLALAIIVGISGGLAARLTRAKAEPCAPSLLPW